MLSGIEDVPSLEDWRRVGPDALPHLLALYNDVDEVPFVRLRAVGATAAFPQPAVRTFLTAVASAREQSDLFIAEAVNAMGRAFGGQALEDLVGYLGHPEPVVREAAARRLGAIGSPPATSALRSRLRLERRPHVRTTIQRALE